MNALPELVGRYAAAIEEHFRNEFPPREGDFLSEGLHYQFGTGGKRLRPALCLLTCELLGGNPRQALPFALATELLHNFLLIHDDIEDGDTMRRDQATLWARFGIPNALNVADYMIARAMLLITGAPLAPETNLRLARAFSDALTQTVEGQALDINLRASPRVDLSTYYKIVTLKTASYLALTWVGGAIVAGLREEQLEGFRSLGAALGPAFQIRDDLIDLTEGKGRGGEIGCDIREGKPSIFFAYVLDRKAGSEEERRRLLDITARSREETTDEDVSWAIDFYKRTGALDFAEGEAARLVAEAERILEELPFDARGREQFKELAHFMIGRKF